MINLPEVKALQKSLLNKFNQPFKVKVDRNNFLKKLAEVNEEYLEFAFGELGIRMKRFVEAVDLNHKLIKSDKNDFLWQALETFEFLTKKKYDLFSAEVKKEIFSKLLKDADLKRLDDPKKNGHCIRFLGSREVRDELRKNKTSHLVELGSFYKKNNWDSYPNNFSFYHRFDNSYEKELKRIKQKAQQFLDLGCKELYNGIVNIVEDTESVFADIYLGFHRITMTTAAVIAAKMHNYAFHNKITASINSFTGFNLVKHTVYSPNSFNYQPRIYPYHELEPTPQIKALMDSLENCGEIGGAIFDRYMVLVPSIEYCQETIDLANETSNNIENTIKHLDMALIKSEHLVPVLLGEKDGRCYFISYWT